MNRTYIAAATLAILFSGCLVVVEKDDDRRDRHRHLYSEWTVEIIVYKTETISSPSSDMTVTFQEDGRLFAATDCGELSGSFEVNDSDALTITGIESRGDCARGDRSFELFSQALADARSYDADERELRIAASDDGMIGFSTRVQ